MPTFNKQQESAVMASLDPTVIVAGAGTGKTFVLINRIVHLIKDLKIDHSKIYVITFTEKSMMEIKERIAKADVSNLPKIGTCHQLCLNLLKHYGEFKDNDFTILNVKSAWDLWAEAKKLWQDDSQNCELINLRQIPAIYSSVQLKLDLEDKKKTFELASLYAASNSTTPTMQWDDFESISREFEVLKKKRNFYDFNDLLVECNKLLKQPDMCGVIKNQFSAILVDEFQDIDEIQFEILKQLTQHGAHIFCVGDPDQSIYNFRGAKPNIFNDFVEHFSNHKLIKLEQNYRSTPEILRVSNQLISRSPTIFQKNLFTNKPSGKEVIFSYAKNEHDSVAWIISQIKTIIKKDISSNYNDIAILYRINIHSLEIEKSFNEEKIPYRIYGSSKLFDKPEIKHIKHYLTLVFEEDSLSLEAIINIPKRKLGLALVKDIHEIAKKEEWSFYDVVMKNPQPASSVERENNFNIFVSQINKIKSLKDENIVFIVDKIIEIFRYANFWPASERSKRMENIKSFVDLMQKNYLNSGKTIPEALSEIDQLSNPSVDKVTLSTVHQAKGLEFKYVFIFKMNQGVMPYFRASRSKEELEEERRIAYVALTRAKEELFLCSFDDDMKSFSNRRMMKKDNVSPYIHEIEDSLIKVNVGRGKILKK